MKEEDLVIDELRKIIENAKEELFLIDPDLDAEFVWDYFVHAQRSVSIRLLTSKRYLDSLLSAFEYWVKQREVQIQLRSSVDFHDRFVIVDQNKCYQLSAPSKGEEDKPPLAIIQITDALTAIRDTYERLWDEASVEFPHPGM